MDYSNFFIIENRSTRKPRLFVLANADPYFSSKLFEVESKDGHELQSYWHAGYLNVILIHDIDLDGNNEIILGGINNAYRRACIAVIEPSHAHGHGPTTPEFTPENLSKGREKYYLLFPLTKLGEILGKSPYNNVNSLMLNKDGSFIVNIEELPVEPPERRGVILYTIIPKMKVITAIGSDTFLKFHEQLVEQGKLQVHLSTAYWEELKNSVLYWDGERFVKQPTGNALYFDAKNLP